MSARIASRQLRAPALAALNNPSTYWICAPSIRRYLSSTPRRGDPNSASPKPTPRTKDAKANTDVSNPVLESYIKKTLETQTSKAPAVIAPKAVLGSLAPSTIFDPEVEIPGLHQAKTPAEREALLQLQAERKKEAELQREYQLNSRNLDPNPRSRLAFERRMVIRGIVKRGRVTRDVELARKERSYQYKSQDLPGSVKKLTKIMNQIAGKTVEEALVQLRFNKKKMAREVWKGLQIARDEAIVKRGMGLGDSPSVAGAEPEDAASTAVQAKAEKHVEAQSLTPAEAQKALENLFPDGTRVRSPPPSSTPTPIELKTGKRKIIFNPTELYVDQAWVGKGWETNSAEYRARGRVNLLTHRSTKFWVILKEEATRIRLSEEIQKKRDSRKVWVALPDRPVQRQRQYCLW